MPSSDPAEAPEEVDWPAEYAELLRRSKQAQSRLTAQLRAAEQQNANLRRDFARQTRDLQNVLHRRNAWFKAESETLRTVLLMGRPREIESRTNSIVRRIGTLHDLAKDLVQQVQYLDSQGKPPLDDRTTELDWKYKPGDILTDNRYRGAHAYRYEVLVCARNMFTRTDTGYYVVRNLHKESAWFRGVSLLRQDFAERDFGTSSL